MRRRGVILGAATDMFELNQNEVKERYEALRDGCLMMVACQFALERFDGRRQSATFARKSVSDVFEAFGINLHLH